MVHKNGSMPTKKSTYGRTRQGHPHLQRSRQTTFADNIRTARSPRRSGARTSTLTKAASTWKNTNGLLRQYLPKGVDLAAFDQAQLDEIALKLNTRPRKTLGYRTPAAMLAEATVALTL